MWNRSIDPQGGYKTVLCNLAMVEKNRAKRSV